MKKVFKVTFVSGKPGESAYDKPTEKVTHGPYYLRGENRHAMVRYVHAHYGPKLETAGRVILSVTAPTVREDVFLRIMAQKNQANMLPGLKLETGKATKRQEPVTKLKPRGDTRAGNNS